MLLLQVSIRFFPDEKAFKTEQDFYHTASAMPPAERSLLPQVCDLWHPQSDQINAFQALDGAPGPFDLAIGFWRLHLLGARVAAALGFACACCSFGQGTCSHRAQLCWAPAASRARVLTAAGTQQLASLLLLSPLPQARAPLAWVPIAMSPACLCGCRCVRSSRPPA